MPVSSSVVTSYYQAIMRATPTSAQVAALSTLADTTALTNTLLGSANNSVDPLIRVYQAAFGRVPDSSGLDYWVGVYNAGGNSVASLQAITAGFAGSTEFRNAYDALDNRGYVSALYANVLGRAGDAAGIDYWVGVLGSGVARSTVLREFASSAEFKATTDSLIDSFLTSAAAGTQTYSGSLLSGAGGATGSSYTLTTSVDAVSGTAANDTITGVLGNGSGTYNFGDQINGGSGTDTLNLLDADGTAVGIVALDGVENVNVRVLVSGAGNTTELNAADWSGVATLSNASSTDDSALEVSGLSISTDVTLYGEASVSVQYANLTSGADTATVSLIGAGSARSASTYASANTENGLATIDIDLENGGLVDAVNIQASGTNYVTLEGGADLRTVNVSGSGAVYMSIDDGITGFNASQFNGTLQVTFASASDVTAVGGAGNDSFLFGTTFSNNDSVDGGNGTDTIRATIAGFNRNMNTTNVENAVLTFSEAAGGTVNASASTVTGYTFAAGTAGNAASLEAAANNSTFTLNDDDLGDVTIDFASGASTTTLNIGSVSGAVGLGTLTITDVAAVTINAVGVSGTVGGSITTASFDADLKSLTIATSGGSADLTIGDTNVDMSLGGTTALSIVSRGSAAITFSNVDLAGSGALRSVTLSANNSNAADITVGDISGSALTSVILSAVSGADIVVGTLDLGLDATGGTQDETISITQGSGSDVTIGAITVSGQGTLNINVSQSGTGVADLAAIALVKSTEASADEVGKNISFGAISVYEGGEVAINTIDMQGAGTGAQVTFGSVTVGQDGGYSAGHISGTATVNVDVSSVNITVGASATATFGNILGLSAGAVGAVTLTLGAEATATFGTVTASAISTHTIFAGSGASANFGGMTSEKDVGAIVIGGVDGADVEFAGIGASGSVGAITVSGALDASLTVTATSVGEINAQQLGVSGSFTIDLRSVTNAAEIKLGAASNVVISGAGNDVITLLGGRTSTAGNDVIRFTTSTQGVDNIINFIAGAAASGGDQIELSGSGMLLENGDGTTADDADAAAVLMLGSTASAMAAGTNVVIMTSAAASTAAMINQVSSQLSFGSAMASAQTNNVLVVWTDGSDSYLTVVTVGMTGATGTTTTWASAASVTATNTTLASIAGVSPGAFVAANFDFI